MSVVQPITKAQPPPEITPPAPRTHELAMSAIFRAVDQYLSDHVEAYHYDVDAGLTRFEQHLSGAPRPGTHSLPASTDSDRTDPARRCAEHLDHACRRYSFLAEVVRATPALGAGATLDWFETHRGPAAAYLTGLRATPLRITSRNTDAFAARLTQGNDGECWLINWLPEVILTRKQVYSLMILDEILTAHDLDSTTMLDEMRTLAADVHLPLEKLLRRLNHIKNPPPRPGWLRIWDQDTTIPDDHPA
ncbi:hypothetical protein [Nocardia sp. alder85J]|uniref:hypothetical protein n=1 Tax=Nocardia sp. alder85J TaxID=2862949 RepID=UPI001CD4A6AA|nr:hypothetical protein [Nocardia sp. alder85J]MCX4093830.1 hypothetical protein [Nocardia sp. alder85J]